MQITAQADELRRIASQLESCCQLYKKRLAFLTSGSRRLFGLVIEHVVTFVIDFQVLAVHDFLHFVHALEKLIQEQACCSPVHSLP